jgi:hypothetical protein
MNILLRFCWCAYDLSMNLYPKGLRESFGCEISELFRQQTLDAWAQGSWSMLLAAIWYAAKDLFTEALPARVGSTAVMAGASSLVCTSATFWCLLWALGNPLAVKAVGDRIHQILWRGDVPVSRPHRRFAVRVDASTAQRMAPNRPR